MKAIFHFELFEHAWGTEHLWVYEILSANIIPLILVDLIQIFCVA